MLHFLSDFVRSCEIFEERTVWIVKLSKMNLKRRKILYKKFQSDDDSRFSFSVNVIILWNFR